MNSNSRLSSGRQEKFFDDPASSPQKDRHLGGRGERKERQQQSMEKTSASKQRDHGRGKPWGLNAPNEIHNGQKESDSSNLASTTSSNEESISRDDLLYNWVKGGKWSELKGFLQSDDDDISEEIKRKSISYKDDYARSPLHYACIRGASKDVIMELLEIGGERLVMKKDLFGRTALHDACFHGTSADVNVVESLLSYGGKKLLMARNDRGRTALHEAVRYGKSANANLIEYLLNQGGIDLVMAKDNFTVGRTALHYACKCGASVNVLKSLVSHGGRDSVMLKDRLDQTPLHYAYIYGGSKDVMRFLVNAVYKEDFGEGPCIALANALGKNNADNDVDEREYSNPIDYFLAQKPIQHDSLIRIQSIWHELDPLAASATYESFSTTLQNVEALKDLEDRDNILGGPFVKTALNQAFVQVPFLLVLFLDLILQLALNIALSFFVTSDNIMSNNTVKFLVFFTGWISFREFTQFYFAKTLYAYLLQQSNWVDLSQITVMILLLASSSSNIDERLLIISIGVSWLRLVLVSGNLVYSVAVFLSALVKILTSLLPLLYVTCIIVIAFAHMFFAAGPPSSENLDPRCLGEEDVEKRWICGLKNSYFKSLSMFLTGDIDFLDHPDGIHSILAMVFGFIMGILLLNIIIAIINNDFSDIQQNSEKAFWANRLRFVNEIDNMKDLVFPKCLQYSCRRRRWVVVPARRSLIDKDLRGYNNWRAHAYFAPFIEWFVDGIENDFFVNRWHRLSFFVRIAEWKEIIPPSMAFRRVLMVKKQHEKLTFDERIISWLASIIFSVLFVAMVPVVLVLGFITCGYFWPRELKQAMFFVKVNTIKNEGAKVLQIKAELEQIRLAHAEEIKRLRIDLENANVVEVDRLDNRLDEILVLLRSIAHTN